MKKGFTLVELLATLIILGIIGLIAFPIIGSTIKDSKESLYQAQLEEIELATEKWAYLNLDLLPEAGNTTTITILELKKAGFLPLDVRDPRNNELLPNDMEVVISYKNGIYEYNVNSESGTTIESEVNENSPILVLNGNPLEYIEAGSAYSDKGAKAKDKAGNILENINIMYQYNGNEIGSINTSEFKTYTVIYSVSSNVGGKNYSSSIARTVIVRDTTNPDLTIPAKVDIALSQASSYNLLTGVKAVDNSGENIFVQTSGYDASLGKKIVSYTACDSHNNCVTKKRIINILSDDAIKPDITYEISDNTLTLKPSNDNPGSTYVWYKDGNVVGVSKNYNLTSTGTYQLEITTGDVVKKSTELEVVGYELKYDKVIFAAKKDDNCILRRNGSYEIETFDYNEKCTITTALNMVKNGYLEYKDNTNFPDFTYDPVEDALTVSYVHRYLYSKDLVSFDYNRVYDQSIDMKTDNVDFFQNIGISEYDIDKNSIRAQHISYRYNTLTYLTQDLKNGDTVVYLNDISNFRSDAATPSYELGFIFWNYQDSTGYTYPELTYSRNIWENLYEYASIDKVNNTITLKQPWNKGDIPSGTKLSQSSSSSVHNYGVLSYRKITSTYNTYSNTITGWQNPSDFNVDKFRHGAKYLSFFMLSNHGASVENKVTIKNIVITEQ